ncbi:allantoate amidohydrolase [Sediminivirga luteola]|uniref:Zn-dependent hydrolase n=1 Tax=Sediminivirga luteola TaxID=1774748 RepID=A0A8J2TV77_9MICO|nr:allantoate amidohydrolase [Sediminivirga luteola]MCI2264659.1 allantoate amidohydrolase [Sediminivirga luteola]GGA02685.1 Zn-dependent hydrolase [Sediminivirga luteola]
MSTDVNALMSAIADIGTDPKRGGYSRPVYSDAELTLREWFVAEAQARRLDVRTDRNGIIWAWWDLPLAGGGVAPRQGALVTGSHLDSVPGGGAFDGPLGVASALAAVDLLKQRETTGALKRRRPLAISVFPEEEGSRFGVACLGSRLLTGAIAPERALNLTDAEGITFGEAIRKNGLDPALVGHDPDTMRLIGDFVELHVEQGRGLNTPGFTAPDGAQPPVAVGSSILGHGRWRLSVHGQGNHAGTTLMTDRADPMVAAAQIVLAVKQAAAAREGARGTVGRVEPVPGGTNVIASRVDLWLDVRHPDDAVTAALVEEIHRRARELAAAEGCTMTMTEESYSRTVHFTPDLTRALQDAVRRGTPRAPVLDTGAGHDAGVLASAVPSGMLFVRNPSGISHSPEEHVEPSDADAGVLALADALEALL